MKILLVDDSAQMRRMLKELLADATTEFVECADGAEAPAIYAQHQPDFVLMDISMPNVDGITATRQILQASPAARILILTNLAYNEFRHAALDAGACGYVLKDDLLHLRQWLELLAQEVSVPTQLFTTEKGQLQ